MVVFFGYMDFLIIYKWLKNWKLYDAHAPSIITMMINLPLKVGKTVIFSLFRISAVVVNRYGVKWVTLRKTPYNLFCLL